MKLSEAQVRALRFLSDKNGLDEQNASDSKMSKCSARNGVGKSLLRYGRPWLGRENNAIGQG